MSDEILEDLRDGVALVTLNRPSRLNAFTAAMGELFDATMVRLATNDSVRAIVLTGAGRGFCAGADMSDVGRPRKAGERASEPPPHKPRPVYDALVDADPEQRSRYVLPLAIGKPVIAAINGPCVGVGLSLAVTCDVRFAAADATFSAIFARRGLTAEVGLAFTLPALVGQGAAADLLLSGRRVDAAEAHRMGLVNTVEPPGELLDHAMAYAQDLAHNVSPRSMRVIKRQLWQARRQDFAETMRLSYHEAGASLKSSDFREGVAHFIERRAPTFTGE